MRILKALIFTFVFVSIGSNLVSADEADDAKMIIRHIVTKIEWNEANSGIVAHTIVVQKYDNQPLQTYPSEVLISGVAKVTDEEAERFVRKHDPEIFESDIIFGHKVGVFKDLSGDPSISQEEIDKWVKLAEEQVEKNYKSPPQIQDTTDRNIISDTIVWAVSLLVVSSLIVVVFQRRLLRAAKAKDDNINQA